MSIKSNTAPVRSIGNGGSVSTKASQTIRIAKSGGGGVVAPVSPILVDLPFPPGVNNLYANVPGRGRVKSKRYREWSNAAGWQLKGQKLGKIKGPIVVFIRFERKDNRRRDIDGLAKAALDLCVTHKIIEDDSLVQELNLKWSDDTRGCRLSIWPAPVHSTEGV